MMDGKTNLQKFSRLSYILGELAPIRENVNIEFEDKLDKDWEEAKQILVDFSPMFAENSNKDFKEWHKENYPYDNRFPNKFEREISERRRAFLAGQASLQSIPKTSLEYIISNTKKRASLATKEKIRRIIEEWLDSPAKFPIPKENREYLLSELDKV